MSETVPLLKRFRNYPREQALSIWVARRADEPAIVASGEAMMRLEDNLHLVQFDVAVLPEFRRRGLGRQLLSRIVELACKEKRRLLTSGTMDRIPAGAAFMNRMGAQRGLEIRVNQLVIADVDRDLLHEWQERARERAAGFEMGLWEGGFPEADIDGIVALHDLLNQIPLGELELEAAQYTAETLRQREKSLSARGFERWTLFVREKSTGKFAGYTDVIWNPKRPAIVEQLMTGVFPEYRNRGLGRWLKAAMLDKILNERPQAKYVKAGNADMNAPMLKINTELGFKLFDTVWVWEVETEKASKYLGQHD